MSPWDQDSDLLKLYHIGTDGGGRNPIQERDYQQKLQQYGLSPNSTPATFQSEQALSTASQAQALQVKANQPAISTLQSQYNPDTGTGALVDRYKSLIDSITAAEQPAVDVATRGVNSALAARGIVSSNQGEGNQELQGVLNPLTANFGQLKAQTGLSEQQDLGNVASQIAGLRAGNVPGALSYAGGLGVAQIGANASIQNAQTDAAARIAAAKAQPQYVQYPTTGLFDTQKGKNVLPTFLNNP